jgi:hypothetical protein
MYTTQATHADSHTPHAKTKGSDKRVQKHDTSKRSTANTSPAERGQQQTINLAESVPLKFHRRGDKAALGCPDCVVYLHLLRHCFADELGVQVHGAGQDKVRMKRKHCYVQIPEPRQRLTGTNNGSIPSKFVRPSSLSRVFMFAKSVPLSGLPPTDDHPFSGCEMMATQKLLSDLPSQQSHGIENYTRWHAKLDHSTGRAYVMN